jgi:MscS family membrane protein
MFLDQYVMNPYLRTIVIGGLLILGLAIVSTLFARAVRWINKKTKTNFNKSEAKRFIAPIVIALFLFIINTSLKELSAIHPDIVDISNKIIYTALVILVGYFIFIFVDIIALSWWRKLASKTVTKIDDNLISIIHGILQVSLIALAIVFVLNVWGIEVGPMLAGLGIAGIAVGLALQPVLTNIIAGISIILDKSINEDDIIYVDDKIEGKVEKIGLRSTKLRTSNDETIIIPNSKLAENRVSNISIPEPKVRIIIPFSIAYGSDIEKARKVVLNEIKTIKNLDRKEPISVRFMKMGDSGLEFEAFFHIMIMHLRGKSDAVDEANTKIYNALIHNKIGIPYPQLDVNLKK